MADANGAITIYEGYLHHHAMYEDPRKRIDPHVRKRMLIGRNMTAKNHLERLQKRKSDQTNFAMAMESFDGLLPPALTAPAPKLDDINEDISPGHFTRPFNYIDMCALALPMAPNQSGLPTSLQIVAPAGQEAFTLKLGIALETVLNLYSFA